jgi:hypothetical protein
MVPMSTKELRHPSSQASPLKGQTLTRSQGANWKQGSSQVSRRYILILEEKEGWPHFGISLVGRISYLVGSCGVM